MTLIQLEKSLKIVRDYMGEATPTQQVMVYLTVARAHAGKREMEVLDIATECKLSSASASRNLSALGDWHWRQKVGAKLVTLVPMMADRRRKTAKLTKLGVELMKKLEAI